MAHTSLMYLTNIYDITLILNFVYDTGLFDAFDPEASRGIEELMKLFYIFKKILTTDIVSLFFD